ncbi:MAG TPA: preprotein translocase subunit SecE [Fimbriimonadales bacterium]|jgi:preprotein translocase SecE subunit|nr:preprotein translocase subunit SecE [Fimbriimonadales bacterium]
MASKSKEPSNPAPQVRMPTMKRGINQFFKDVGVEMRRVVWPTRADTVRLTAAVLFVCVMFVVYLYIAGELVHLIIRLMETGKA